MRARQLIFPAAAALSLCTPSLAQQSRDDLLRPSPPAPEAAAAPAGEIDQRELDTLVENLGAPDLASRRAASEALARRADIPLETIEQALRAPKLSPEQHRRLITIAWQRFRTEPRPAMGVRTDPRQQGRGALLESITPGFPSTKVLRSGDRIDVLAGHRLTNFDQLRHVILSHDPGDQLPATIIRDGEVMNVEIELGHYRNLNQDLVRDDLLAAFRNYRARDYYDYRGTQPDIEHGTDPKIWDYQHAVDVDQAWSNHLYGIGEPDALHITAGGEPRGGKAAPDNVRVGAGNARAINNDLQQLRMLETQLAQRRAELQAVQTKLQEPNLDPELRRVLLQSAQVQQAYIRSLDQAVRQSRAQLIGR